MQNTGVTEPRHHRAETLMDFVDDCIVESEEQDLSTQCLLMKKNQPVNLQDYFERYCIVLTVFGFNSAKYDLNEIKSCLLPILVKEGDIESTVTMKTYQFVLSKFGDFQLLRILNYLGGTTILNSFLKAYKTNETEGVFPCRWFVCTDKLSKKELPPYDFFWNLLRNINSLEKHYNDIENFVQSGFSREQALEIRVVLRTSDWSGELRLLAEHLG